MEYTLMHKRIPVVDLTIDDKTGSISDLKKVHDILHLPIGIKRNNLFIERSDLNEWWKERSIPASRDGIKDVINRLNINNTSILLSKSFGLSLSDQYWICPKDSGLRWEDVNFFENEFSKDIGEILFGYVPDDPAKVNFKSPDNASDGVLKKKWIIAEDKRVLMKGSKLPFHQQPFNEVIACAIMKRLNITHVPYTLTFSNNNPYSLCENFVTSGTELVHAWNIIKTCDRDNSVSEYMHFLRACEKLEIPNVQAGIDKMLTLDYIIHNEDRHYNNFGFIRNAETLEWLCFSPVYDSGTSLWHDNPIVGENTESRPFVNSHKCQINLVKDFSWFDCGNLDGLDDEIKEIFSASLRVDEKRCAAISEAVTDRCRQIETIANRT